jgi:hypothetical protein
MHTGQEQAGRIQTVGTRNPINYLLGAFTRFLNEKFASQIARGGKIVSANGRADTGQDDDAQGASDAEKPAVLDLAPETIESWLTRRFHADNSHLAFQRQNRIGPSGTMCGHLQDAEHPRAGNKRDRGVTVESLAAEIPGQAFNYSPAFTKGQKSHLPVQMQANAVAPFCPSSSPGKPEFGPALRGRNVFE